MSWILTAEDGRVLLAEDGSYFLSDMTQSANELGAAGSTSMTWRQEREDRAKLRRQLEYIWRLAEFGLTPEEIALLDSIQEPIESTYVPVLPPEDALNTLSVLPIALQQAQDIKTLIESAQRQAIREANLRQDEDDVIALLTL